MKRTLFGLGLFLGLVLLLIPGGLALASGNSGNVGLSFSTDQLTCGQDNNVSLTVANQGLSGSISLIGIGFESQYNPEIKSPSQGQDGVWNINYRTDSGYTGVTYETTAANAIGPGENAIFSTKVYVPCGPTEIKVLGAAAENIKSNPVVTQPTFKMVSGVSVTTLPKTGADPSTFSLVFFGLPALLGLRKFIK